MLFVFIIIPCLVYLKYIFLLKIKSSFLGHYMMAFPLQENNLNMSETYSRYWKDSWIGLQVGHRGLGNSYHNQPKR